MTPAELVACLEARAATSERNSFALARQRLYGEALLAEERARAYRLAAEDARRVDASTGTPGAIASLFASAVPDWMREVNE